MIAEAIESGYVNSADGAEITTGLLDIAPDTLDIPKWYRVPKLSPFIVQQAASAESKREREMTASIEEQLQACNTRQDVLLLVEQSFCDQLRKLLMLPDVSNSNLLSK